MNETILLDRTMWDLVLDSNSSIAIASDPYATLQSVCNAIRTWLGECWYDTSLGVPYDTEILQGGDEISAFISNATTVAEAVPNVSSVYIIPNKISKTRQLTGLVFVTLENGVQVNGTF